MKILIFYQYFGTTSGSWSTRMYELSRRWVQSGHQVTVVTAPYEKSDIRAKRFISRTVVDDVNLIIINSGDSNRDPFLLRSLKALLFSISSSFMALTVPCDVVIASSGPITVGIPALVAKWFRRKKMIFEIRDLWPQGALELGKIKKDSLLQKLALWFESVCYRNAATVVACSPGMADSVKARFPKVQVTVISNASDTYLFSLNHNNTFKFPDHLANKKLFIYAGSLGLMDHGHLMIDAMKHVTDPDIQLVIIGEGAFRNELEALAISNQSKNIHFLGLLPKKEVALWLGHACAALVLFKNYPVLQTSSPNKLFDAFAAGVPVIHNTTGWIKDLFDKEQCGISTAPDDTEALATAILMLVKDENIRKKFAVNSKRMADTVFNRDVLAREYLDVLTCNN